MEFLVHCKRVSSCSCAESCHCRSDFLNFCVRYCKIIATLTDILRLCVNPTIGIVNNSSALRSTS